MDCQTDYLYKGLKIRKLGHSEVAWIHELMQDVVSRLPQNVLFAMDDQDYFHDLLEQNGEIYGAYNQEILVAYSVLASPGKAEGNLGREFGVPEAELPRVWVLDSTIVHESGRGLGLQRLFNDLREQRARQLGGHYLYATVHPDNAASLRNLEHAQLVLQFTRPMYGGVLRHCLAKKL
ncbi:GNAT family N-acetyltransferase [Paenibacillus filicis]|uniref:GNAT family N-acetyltransferase n=1 Tax=Paenibacillus filicis TaxID=669464 RepID=A0ABU9DCA3_9BACL